jgi:hypothetical protein
VARVVDWAGNSSESVTVATPILLDTTPPAVSVSLGGLRSSGSRFYLNDTAAFTLEYTCEDEDSSSTAQFALVETAENAPEPTWVSDFPQLKARLVQGKTYEIALRGTNAAGASREVYSTPFTYDTSAPEGLVAQGAVLSDLASGEQVGIHVEAIDAESSVESFKLSLGSTPGGNDLTALIPGNLGGYLVQEAAGSNAEFGFTVPQIADGRYYVSLEATNGAGLATSSRIDGLVFSVNNSLEKLIVNGQGRYTSSADTLRASWSYSGSREPVGYSYRIVGAGGTIRDWIQTTSTWVVETGLGLVHGDSYHFEVRAVFADSSMTPAVSGESVTVDLTLPQFDPTAGFTLPTACTSNDLEIGWKLSDGESGIKSIRAILERIDESGDIVRVVDESIRLPVSETASGVRLSSDADGNPLALPTGTRLLITLRVTNGAGATVDKAASAIMIDNSPPPVPVVVDQGNVINTAQYLVANWLWTANDSESGTTGFQWALVVSPGALGTAEWHDAATGRRVDLMDTPDIGGQYRVHQSVWYFAVKARNGAGLESVGFSDGITYDATAPYVAEVKLIGAGAGGEAAELNYITDASNLAVYIGAIEDVSAQGLHYEVDAGVLEYGVWTPTAAETMVSDTQPIPVEASAVVAGKVNVFRAQVVNEAGLVSEYGFTEGVVLDAARPVVTGLQGRIAGDDLYFDWNVVEGVTPITGFKVELLTAAEAAGGPVGSKWVDIGSLRSMSYNRARDGLVSGEYVFFVKALNAANLESQVVSKMLVFDTSVPRILSVTFPRFASSSVAVHANVAAGGSGVSGYQYAVGTFENPACYSGDWIEIGVRNAVLDHTVALSALSVPVSDGAVIRVSLRVRSGAGVWSQETISAPITIDKTKAATPVVSASVYTTSRIKIDGISIASSDAQSGITRLRMGVVGAAGQGMPGGAFEQPVGTGGDFIPDLVLSGITLQDLALGEGGEYYIAVQTQNGAGDWSAIGYSAKITVDSIAPTLSFVEGASVVVNYGPATIHYTSSEQAMVDFTIIDPSGASEKISGVNATAGVNTFVVNRINEGTYTVRAVPMDAAGNMGEIGGEAATIRVRINAAPKISLLPFETTPGKPLELKAVVYDPDGDGISSWSWSLGDGSPSSSEASPIHAYYQISPTAQQSVYMVVLTAVDALGKSTTEVTSVTVENTRSGKLYTNEYWTGVHTITGVVTVPTGLTLTIVNAEVTADGGLPRPEVQNVGIVVEGSLNISGGSLLQSTGGVLWKGIYVTGTLEAADTTITGAERAVVVVSGATAALMSVSLKDNLIGVHVLGGSLDLESCLIEGNLEYGVKEDAKGAYRLLNNRFHANTVDYYDVDLTGIGMERLNSTGTNAGNIRE